MSESGPRWMKVATPLVTARVGQLVQNDISTCLFFQSEYREAPGRFSLHLVEICFFFDKEMEVNSNKSRTTRSNTDQKRTTQGQHGESHSPHRGSTARPPSAPPSCLSSNNDAAKDRAAADGAPSQSPRLLCPLLQDWGFRPGLGLCQKRQKPSSLF